MDHIVSQIDLVYVLTHYAFQIRFNIIHPAHIMFFSLHSRSFIVAILFGDILSTGLVLNILIYI
jgi:hypothetical protein